MGTAGQATAAAEARRAGREGRKRAAERTAEYLGLTEAQRASWRALLEKQREQMEPLRAEGREMGARLRQALDAEAPEAATVGEAMLAVKAHRQKARAQHEAFEQQLRALLSPEQQQKLDAMKAARRTLTRGRGDRGGRPGVRERRRDVGPLSAAPAVRTASGRSPSSPSSLQAEPRSSLSFLGGSCPLNRMI